MEMKGRIVALGLLAASCGDPVRRPFYDGQPLITFSAQLLEPPAGYQPGDSFTPEWWEFDGSSGGGTHIDRFAPAAFPAVFKNRLSEPPQLAPRPPLPTAGGGSARVALQYLAVRSDRFDGRTAALNHWLGYSDAAVDVLPFGAGGPSLHLEPGFNLVRRTCVPGTLNNFENVPLDTVIEVVPITRDAETEYRARCGAPLPPPPPP